MSAKPKIISIVGPTSSGKTSLSIDLAKRFNGEVISADSRQVYKGMDLGTGKVTKEEMEGIPHHLLDVAEPMDIYTGADFKKEAEKAISDIISRKKLPIVAGGTFFYVELLQGKMQAAPVEPNYKYREELEKYSDRDLFKMIEEADSNRANNIDPNNRPRLIRSLEIIKELGKVPEVVQVESNYEWLNLGIETDKEQLHKRIHNRIEERLNNGMLEEVERLLENGVTPERLESLGLEYRYISLFLRGEITKDEMAETLETKTKQFSKRQKTWLKRDESIFWYKLDDSEEIQTKVQTFLNTK